MLEDFPFWEDGVDGDTFPKPLIELHLMPWT